jgi:hypothetical protein
MSPLTAAELVEIARLSGAQVTLTENFDLDVRPASRLWPGYFEILKAEKPKLVKYLAGQAAKQLLQTGNDGAILFEKYHDHHFRCAQCIAAGLGYEKRCPDGKLMWFQYRLESFIDD